VEVDPGFHQPGQEVEVAGQAVDLGDDQDGALVAAERERALQLRAGGSSAG
jgi:hypothetical protein